VSLCDATPQPYSGNRIDATLVSRHKELQREVCDLTEAEEQLDELISKCNLQLRLLTEDPQNKKYPFGHHRVSSLVTFDRSNREL